MRLSYLRMLGWSAVGGVIAGWYFMQWPKYGTSDGRFEFWGWPMFAVIWELMADGTRIDFPNPLNIFINPIMWFVMILVPGMVIITLVNIARRLVKRQPSLSGGSQITPETAKADSTRQWPTVISHKDWSEIRFTNEAALAVFHCPSEAPLFNDARGLLVVDLREVAKVTDRICAWLAQLKVQHEKQELFVVCAPQGLEILHAFGWNRLCRLMSEMPVLDHPETGPAS